MDRQHTHLSRRGNKEKTRKTEKMEKKGRRLSRWAKIEKAIDPLLVIWLM